MPSVLVVEDDGVIARAIAAHLRHAGLDVVVAEDGDKGLRKLRYEQHDVAVVDLMLPGVDGWALTQEARREGIATPILIVSARSSEHDKVHALEIGADDYLAKPFEPRELVARIQAVLRRGAPHADDERVTVGRLELNWNARSAHLDGVPLTLTTAEFDLLGLLARNRGRILSRDRIMDETRGVDWEAFDRSVDVLVSRVRQKLGDDPRQPAWIRTVRGAGYIFIGGGDG
jgi:DNA-binding response OmpR family regulator